MSLVKKYDTSETTSPFRYSLQTSLQNRYMHCQLCPKWCISRGRRPRALLGRIWKMFVTYRAWDRMPRGVCRRYHLLRPCRAGLWQDIRLSLSWSKTCLVADIHLVDSGIDMDHEAFDKHARMLNWSVDNVTVTHGHGTQDDKLLPIIKLDGE